MEGRVEDAEVIRLPSFPGPKGVLLGLVATAPDEIKGWTVIFRFESVDEASYRLLSSRRGGLFRVTAQDGRAVFSGSSIVFVSDHTPTFTPIDERAYQVRQPTSKAVGSRTNAWPHAAMLASVQER